MNNICLICSSNKKIKPRSDLKPHPYVQCTGCGIYFNPDIGDKVFEAHHEISGDQMSDTDKTVNMSLADGLYHNHLAKKVVKAEEKFEHLDIGSKYPYLGHCLQKVSEGHLNSTAIDGIDEVIKFSKKLGVKSIKANFEDDESDKIFKNRKYHLITLIHCLEHFYDPLKTLRKIRSLMYPGAILFIRSPDHEVEGIQRDFTEGHYSIHPTIWCESAMYEALVQLKDCFRVEETYTLYGQRDYILRAIEKQPMVAAGYIVKNEERHLPASLDSIKNVVDFVCIRDTGSTDKTWDVVHNHPLHTNYEKYFGASEKDKNGDWQLWDFGKARNEFVKYLDKRTDWILWMDADDVMTKEAARIVRRAPYMPFDIHNFCIKTGNDSITHHRMWRANSGVKFVGACHEYPEWPAKFKVGDWNEAIVHNGEETSVESSVKRNLRILERSIKTDTTLRNIFYLANTYRDDKQFRKAIEYYDKYLNKGGGTYFDEMMFCYIFKARSARFLKDHDLCLQTVREGIAKDWTFAELYMEACYTEQDRNEYWNAISWATQATRIPFRQRLFTEYDKYTDQPLRMLCHSFNNLKWTAMALAWGDRVKEFVNDPSWETFLSSIRGKVININRPGALGDVLLTGWTLRGLREKYPGHEIAYYTKCKEMAELLPVDKVLDSDDWETRKNGIDYCLTGYPIKEGYPNVPMKKHLINYFSEEAGVKAYRPLLKMPYLTRKNYFTIHTKAGWSTYKNWPLKNWIKLVKEIKDRYAIEVIQIGGKGDPRVIGTTNKLGLSLKGSLQLIQTAKCHLGVDSFSNHAAGLFETPAVILFGSTSAIGSGYDTAFNLSLNLPCSPCYKEDPKISKQSQGICQNPPDQTYDKPKHACLTNMTVEYVFNQVQKMKLKGEMPCQATYQDKEDVLQARL